MREDCPQHIVGVYGRSHCNLLTPDKNRFYPSIRFHFCACLNYVFANLNNLLDSNLRVEFLEIWQMFEYMF